MGELDIDVLVRKDAEYRQLLSEVEGMRAQRNTLSKECKENPEAREKVKELKVELKEKEEKVKELREDPR